MKNHRKNSVVERNREQGAVLAVVVICLPILLGMAALAIDLGHLYVVKSELQRSADNGALAGAKEYADLSSAYGDDSVYEKLRTVRDRAKEYVRRNPAGNKSLVLEDRDLVLGYLSDPYDRSLPIDTTANPADFNVVQVTTRRTADSVNGPVGLFFARIFGKQFSDVSATATAVLDDRFQGIEAPDGANTPLIPFVLKARDWQDQIVNGTGSDQYSINLDDGTVMNLGDGIPEIQLYTQEDLGPSNKEEAATEEAATEDGAHNEGAGNFGILNVGVLNNSAATVVEQIREGITGEQICAEFGQNYVDVYTDSGQLIEYDVEGNPGFKASVESALEDRLGQIVGFFVYDEVIEGTGNNTTFNIVGIQFGRIVYVDLTGPIQRLVIQPAAYTGRDVRTGDNAPGTGGLIAKLQLIR